MKLGKSSSVWFRILVAVALSVSSRNAVAQHPSWSDPSLHQVLIVEVEPQVRLEVLYWGGTGEPMVFLAGMGNTAHSFDSFAPRFRDAFRVYALTRRGFGASSHPEGGYDSARRARDILAALDSLGLTRVILVGHSIAGDELSRFAVDYPERVRALIYLDAYSYGKDAPAEFPPDPPQSAPPPIVAAESASVQGVVGYWARRFRIQPVEAEVRAVGLFSPTGQLERFVAPNASGKVYAGAERSDYERIQAPALAIYATHDSVQQLFPTFAAFDQENRRMAEVFFSAQRQYEAAQIGRFRAGLRQSVVLEIPGANHYIHYSHAREVEDAMRRFLAR